jgi:Fe-S-cluster containining protein
MKKFSCNSCTGCCHGPIALTHEEAINTYGGQFPLIITYVVSDVRNVPVEMDGGAYARGMRTFTREYIGFYDKTSTSRKIVVHPQIITFIQNSTPCVNLNSDKTCKIYSSRPSVCRLYPFRIDTPVSLMEDGLLRERNFSYEGHGHIPCQGWEGSENIIFSTGMPSDRSVIDAFNARLVEAKFTRNLLKKYYFQLKGAEEVSAKVDLYSQLNDQSGRLLQVSYAGYILWLYQTGEITKENCLENVRSHKEQLKKSLLSIVGLVDNSTKTFTKMYESHILESEVIEADLAAKDFV